MSRKRTPHRILAKDAIAGTASALAQHMPARKLLLVCDDNTWVAAGESIMAQLAATHAVIPHSLGRSPHPTVALAHEIAAGAAEYDALLAVGSGTINDIVKHAAAVANKPYSVIATAASMNGYTSGNASLEEDGFKHSFPAAPPKVVIADTTLIAASPKRLTRAGLGDTLCRSTVEADSLMSHWLLGNPYPRALFDRMRSHEAELISTAAGAREGDNNFITKLMEALLDAGDAMAEHGSSAPASQGEHMIAHTLELNYGVEMRGMLHGEVVALATVTMNHLQHKMLLSQPSVKPLVREEAQFLRVFGKKTGNRLYHLYQQKILSAEQVVEVNERIRKNWQEIKAALIEIMASPTSIERAFIHSGIATKPAEVGLNDERYRFACTYAYLTRERFTFLDLAAMNDKRVS